MDVNKLNVLLKQLKDAAIIEHYYCEEDCWYICPKHSEGCCDYNQSGGVDVHNKKIESLYEQIKDVIGE